MKKIILAFFFITSVLSSQNIDFNNIKIDDVKNIINNFLNKNKPEKNQIWSGVPGDLNFNINDRIAIKDVIDAYGIYWDTNNLEGYLSLFTDDAIGVHYDENGDKKIYQIKSESEIKKNEERMNFFINNNMQRRHMMSNSLIIDQSKSFVHLIQYMTLLTTNNKQITEFVTPISYIFKLSKIDDIWKISYREIILDKPFDLKMKN
ncbi:MAG: nuclear transport factor 2 family protein [Bacteroidota bacterium]|nr:nuclear transport factor 2 family protein [Bacteroidota bacterium]